MRGDHSRGHQMTTDNTIGMGTVTASGILHLPDGTRRFLPGHVAALKHGARSARLEEFVAARADELTADLFRNLPHLQRADVLAVKACATAEAIVERLLDYALEHGMILDGKPTPVLGHLKDWMKRAEAARARIGADPRSARDLAVSELHVRDLAGELQDAMDARARVDKRMAIVEDTATP